MAHARHACTHPLRSFGRIGRGVVGLQKSWSKRSWIRAAGGALRARSLTRIFRRILGCTQHSLLVASLVVVIILLSRLLELIVEALRMAVTASGMLWVVGSIVLCTPNTQLYMHSIITIAVRTR